MPTRHPDRKLERKSYQNSILKLVKPWWYDGPPVAIGEETPVSHIVGVGSWTRNGEDFVTPRLLRGFHGP